MKTAEQKQRIREMLRAEGLVPGHIAEKNPDWSAFKSKLNAGFLAAHVPALEIMPAPRAPLLSLRWLVPVCAVGAIAVSLVLGRNLFFTGENPVVAKKITTPQPVVRTMHRGDVFKSEKREIRFLGGNATLTETGGKIQIVASELKADFRLGQKIDMRIEHPLVAVTITGTRFVFNAAARGGSIHLTEGNLKIVHRLTQETILLAAPAQFEFSERGAKKSDAGKILFRYELTNGEIFFAHQIHVDSTSHRVEILGGKQERIPLEEIVRFAAVEKP